MCHEDAYMMAVQYICSKLEVYDVRQYQEVVHAIYGKDSLTDREYNVLKSKWVQ
jgi:hypothetical protein